MSGRHHQTEKDKKKVEQDKLQMILNRLLKEEENKYCADCEAKGPRWASWNLGVFLCIRCAGIHRNLGVHLSKVKSVNLDTWTVEQCQHMRVIGNSVGKAVYEASLPEHFRRPQTDSALEAFIRGKYEHKRYIMKDYVPAKIDPRDLLTSDEFLRPLGVGGTTTNSSGTESGKSTKKTTLNLDPKPAAAAAVQNKRDSAGGSGKERVRRRSSNSTSNSQQQQQLKVDGKSSSEAHSASVATALNDLVDLELGGGGGASGWITASAPNLAAANNASGLDDLLGLNVVVGGQVAPSAINGQQQTANATSNGLSELNQELLFGGGAAAEFGGGGNKKTKNDILALYGSASGGQQQAQAPMMTGLGYGMPPTQQMPFVVAGVGVPPNQMMNLNHMAPTNNWMTGENAMSAYGNVVGDPGQQQQGGFVATPFGYVPVAQTQQQQQSAFPQMANMAPQAAQNNSSNLHLQSIQQQLASLQLQRTQQQQQQPSNFGQPQQDTLATNLWH